jgi:plasmid stabilization system protein ParE
MGYLIRVKLTFGEQSDNAQNNAINAESLINNESDSKMRQEKLFHKLDSMNGSVPILSLEKLFHRHINGFGEIKQFVGDLVYLLSTNQLKLSPLCYLHAFTFAFLAAAKNYDLFMDIVNKQEVKEQVKKLAAEIKSLTEFERIGKPLPEEYSSLKAPYLSLRQIIARPSARDEQRILSLVLLSGSTTFEQLEACLDGNTSLVQRILAMFKGSNVIIENQSKYFINENYLAIVLFCLRETQGLDPISMLQNLLRDP